MSSCISPIRKSIAVLGLLFPLLSVLHAKPKDKPDLRELITEISRASKLASGKADAVDLVDHVTKWEQLIKVSDHLSKLINAQIDSMESTLEEFKNKAIANPSKARLYDSLASDSKEQISQLGQVKEAIAIAAERLRMEVARVRENPEAAEILQLRTKQRLIRQKVDKLDSLVSPEVTRALEEAE